MKSLLDRPNIQLSLISGILTGISYPPSQLGFIAWIALIPLFHIWLNASPGKVAKFSFISAVVSNILVIYWISFNSGTNIYAATASMVGGVVYLALWWMIGGFLFSKFRKKVTYPIYMIPFFWVSMEFLRSFGALGFPWLNIALTQTQFISIIQSADLFGTYGIGAWVVIVNLSIYLAIIKVNDRKRYLVFSTALIVLAFIYGNSRIYFFNRVPVENTLKIAVTQPNIDPNEKWDPEKRDFVFDTMFEMLDSALVQKPDLVLWPESALPANLRLSGVVKNKIYRKLAQSDGSLLTGTPDYERTADEEINYYNASILLSTRTSSDFYRKIKLVPFGEYIPLSPYFPILKNLNFGQANFLQGNKFTIFELGGVKISNVICYESSFPDLIAEFRRKGAEILTIQANDGWLGKSSGPYQHFELARLRAVENRMSVVRAANTGISGVIYPDGSVKHKIALNHKELIFDDIPVSRYETLYSQVPWLLPLFSILTCLLAYFRPWQRKHY